MILFAERSVVQFPTITEIIFKHRYPKETMKEAGEAVDNARNGENPRFRERKEEGSL